jgi:hypothetical protein
MNGYNIRVRIIVLVVIGLNLCHVSLDSVQGAILGRECESTYDGPVLNWAGLEYKLAI